MPTRCFMIEPVYNADGSSILHWVRPDTGEVFKGINSAPPGAMHYMPWIEKRLDETPPSIGCYYHKGPDGRVLGVQTPGGHWIIDSRCSNCTKKDDNVHSCWVRHGTPPNITVDKNGVTCSAGGGSIQCGSYHGFLRNGELI